MKSLETEYRDAISLELPDLWSRIEAGVDEYEANKKNEKIAYIDKKEETESDEDLVIKKIKRRKTIALISRYAAAAACLILAVGVFRMIGGSKDSASTAPMADTATAYEASDSVAYEAASDEASYTKAEESNEAAAIQENAEFDEAPAAAVEEYEGVDSDSATLSAETDDNKYAKAREGVVADDQMISVISEALECDASDATKIALQLSIAGIKNPVEFEAVDNAEELTLNHAVKTDENVLIYSFTDEATDDKYLICLNKADDGTVKLLSVIKNDDTKEVIYEENKTE